MCATGSWGDSASVLTFFSAGQGALLKKMTDRPLSHRLIRALNPLVQAENTSFWPKGGMQKPSYRPRSYVFFSLPMAAPEKYCGASPAVAKLSVNSPRGTMAALGHRRLPGLRRAEPRSLVPQGTFEGRWRPWNYPPSRPTQPELLIELPSEVVRPRIDWMKHAPPVWSTVWFDTDIHQG